MIGLDDYINAIVQIFVEKGIATKEEYLAIAQEIANKKQS